MKPIKTTIKIQLPAGAATPAPPVGTVLGPHGINLGQFCQQFNDATKEMTGSVVPAVITIYEDRSFEFQLKTPPASDLLKKAAGIEKGSGNPLRDKVGKVTRKDIEKIAEKKMVDLNARDQKAAEKIIEGTARSMGIEIEN
ncbi:MAG: 50S ribosomal protein L11 [Candidatus Wolfebacteria bacterium GW2011_GWC1_43_10]|uniref:Large ribosomal subunit protein uL11 n=2 Tax=Candidatus Wolfeibacteriota TaxID=1752735 RepID=A0A0G1CBR5_9BACT|nr:MAG: 50S ribosomal protein L11 [Candidatus Wolfebacteria bacterium GW2011_GWC1_43_10]KKT22375.1 MAG: 50S ribosomal protein L11 [Parcubacteria group bacterium GW2011_GWB1_43_8b]OGM90221.1 MAG: 50S ribosomal protein L11 [Candidatus Wolfebacteria bacterium GWA1_42_9]